MIQIKYLLLIVITTLLFSCLNKQSDFVCHLKEIDTYMTISKRSGISYIVFSNTSGISSPSDTIDYIKIKNNVGLCIIYDTIK